MGFSVSKWCRDGYLCMCTLHISPILYARELRTPRTSEREIEPTEAYEAVAYQLTGCGYLVITKSSDRICEQAALGTEQNPKFLLNSVCTTTGFVGCWDATTVLQPCSYANDDAEDKDKSLAAYVCSTALHGCVSRASKGSPVVLRDPQTGCTHLAPRLPCVEAILLTQFREPIGSPVQLRLTDAYEH